MSNKFDKAVQNRSSEILDTGKRYIEADVEAVEIKETSTDHNEFNLNDMIERTEKTFKNKTYYLETSINEEVKKMAKKQKVSESKLVNDILKHVLNVK